MASLTLAPQGLLPNRSLNDNAPNYSQATRFIKKGYATAIGFGDLVETQFAGNVGYIQIYTAGDTHALGVFAGCEYYDTVNAKWTFNNNWPTGGVSTPGDIRAFVIIDPRQVYTIQVSGGPATVANIGQNCELTGNGTVTAATGISTAAVLGSSFATTATLPLRVVGISTRFFVGYDPVFTNPELGSTFPTNNYVDVVLNTSEFTQTTGA